MKALLLARLAAAVPVALLVTLLSFFLVYLAPGDPISAIAPAGASEQTMAKLRESYHLDQPVLVRYGYWLARAAVGDLGVSIANGRPVRAEISASFENTFILASVAAFLAIALGSVAGCVAGLTTRRWLDTTVMAILTAALSMPAYWVGIVLVLLFSVWLPIFPGMGLAPDAFSQGIFSWRSLSAVLLPAFTLALLPAGVLARSWRAAIANVREQHFVFALTLRGVSAVAIKRHILKNAFPSVLPVIGIQLGYLLGGSILVEVVFNWPGTGLLLYSAIFQRDIAVLQGVVLVLGMMFVLINLCVDVAQVLIDPRIRRA